MHYLRGWIEGQETCALCEQGKFASEPGASACIDCAAGTFSDNKASDSGEGTVNCKPCSHG